MLATPAFKITQIQGQGGKDTKRETTEGSKNRGGKAKGHRSNQSRCDRSTRMYPLSGVGKQRGEGLVTQGHVGDSNVQHRAQKQGRNCGKDTKRERQTLGGDKAET